MRWSRGGHCEERKAEAASEARRDEAIFACEWALFYQVRGAQKDCFPFAALRVAMTTLRPRLTDYDIPDFALDK
jgi:hypothetical protein